MADLLTIGVLAHLSAEVDAVSGYRRYARGRVSDACVVAHLRRVGMPLGELSLVLDLRALGQFTDAQDVVAAHQTRLEEGLFWLRGWLVRFAVWESPDDPFGVLAGVLVDVVPGGLRLVATDRCRLGLGQTAARTEGGDVSVARDRVGS